MTIITLTQKAMAERRRFTWPNFSGSIYVVNEGRGWGFVAVSGRLLIDLAKQIFGPPDEKARNSLDHTYATWADLNPYQLADLLYQADKMLSH